MFIENRGVGPSFSELHVEESDQQQSRNAGTSAEPSEQQLRTPGSSVNRGNRLSFPLEGVLGVAWAERQNAYFRDKQVQTKTPMEASSSGQGNMNLPEAVPVPARQVDAPAVTQAVPLDEPHQEAPEILTNEALARSTTHIQNMLTQSARVRNRMLLLKKPSSEQYQYAKKLTATERVELSAHLEKIIKNTATVPGVSVEQAVQM